ncbi:MAG: 16S rRNA (cytidine(1402)-2'-O)-methyltransferase [Candidatus Aminicenantes bacterium]|nr:MAG: 16S rRNA (cytidine(1402)-2'-O)-methyltransferase [Candidatus Aminicenantes bacterium]
MSGENTANKTTGNLYVVATPIGNLEDITFRALRILREVAAIACEDTRQTIKLLNNYNLRKKLLSYYHPREKQKIPRIINLLKEGKDVALVSDAGTPGLSDPGYPLIREAIKEGIKIIPIPGASALTAALAASGLPTHRFLFFGFAPTKKEATKKLLHSLQDEKATLVFYLPPRKTVSFLKLIREVLGNRQVVIAREMTKIYEEFLRGPADDLIERWEEQKAKGEATVLIQGSE